MSGVANPVEAVEEFRLRARHWLAANMPRKPHARWDSLTEDDDRATLGRSLQRRLWEGGFAGICYPREYGGLGLTIEHQQAFDAEAAEYQLPMIFSIPTHSIIGPLLLDCGTEEQKARFIPKMLSGDELWVQMISEPSGGSDMAGALTRATRDGEVFILNGSKVWSTYAYRADFAICLARTDWSVPKHRGLTMFIVPVQHPRTTIVQIEMIDGTKEFCQEYFDDVDIPVANVIGAVNDGWTIASRLMFHEKTASGGASPYMSVPYSPASDVTTAELIEIAREAGTIDDPETLRQIGWFDTLRLVRAALNVRVRAGLQSGDFPEQAGAISRLAGGLTSIETANISFRLAGVDALCWDGDGGVGREAGIGYVQRQARCIGGGTTEMARNVVAERVLGMPREPAPDRDVAFEMVKRNG
jgi:alkylation response protein AidB-like acyl-CoA dehydrogenase